MSPKSDVDVDPRRVSVVRGPDHYRDSAAIRELVLRGLNLLGLPADFVTPGDRVVLKPNWVKEHDERHPDDHHWDYVVTHPTVIETVIEWVAQQLKGRGSIVICDAPQTDSSFAKIRAYCGLDEMVTRSCAAHPGLKISLMDLRPEEWHAVDGVTVSKTKLPGDPAGSTRIELNGASEFVGYHGLGRLYGASYDMAETNQKHSGSAHQYLLCRTPMDADVLINLPKLKTHKKVGITCALKNLVGINANKNWLPHHTEGTPDQGGDQFATSSATNRIEHSWMGGAKRWLKNRPVMSRLFVPIKKMGRVVFGDTQKVIRSGNWHGNDTCWRMVLDLNKCLFLFDGAGEPRKKTLRYLAVVDGIIGGEGNGPMSPDPKSCGVVICGVHPAAVDCVAATLMGFDWQKLRMLKQSFSIRELNFVPFQPGDINITSDNPVWCGAMGGVENVFSFRPHFGWAGAIEARGNHKVTAE